MLQLKDIKKDYKTAGAVVPALKGVSLNFRRNEFVSILGPSGCGKTTLLNIIGGLDQYTSGDLVISGVSTKDYKDRDWDVYRNHRIGFVFQSYNLIPHQTVLGNVEIALTIAGLSKAERKKRAEEALVKVGLGKELHKRPNQLSGGQMQRVAIARALVNNPEILLADEPTGALDTVTSVQIMDLIREIAGERLVIMVTHNPELAEQYSSRIVRLQDGLVVSDSNPYEGEERAEVVEPVAEQQEQVAEKPKKKAKKEKAAMSFWTALGLSARNLWTKKGRTMITSFAGSIGIISVCLVLALSNGFNGFILKTEEDMLSSSPVSVSEKTVDVDTIMEGMTGTDDMPDLDELGNQIYVNSFLTNMAKGMMIENDISDAYLDYVSKTPKSAYKEIVYSTGAELTNNLFVSSPFVLNENSTLPPSIAMDGYTSVSMIKGIYTNYLKESGASYADLANYVSLLGEVVNVMPGTADFSQANYAEYLLSQYDVIAVNEAIEGNVGVPRNSDEAVLVIGQNNDLTDILMAQLGLLTVEEFVPNISAQQPQEIVDEDMLIPFDRIFNTEYRFYFNDSIYQATDPAMGAATPFTYLGVQPAASAPAKTVKITGVLRLKEGLNYGCLSEGLNVTEKLVSDYVESEKETPSPIVQYIRSHINEQGVYTGVIPAESLYAHVDLNTRQFNAKDGLAALGGSDEITKIEFYSGDFEAKKALLNYLDEWNEMCDQGTEEKPYEYTWTDADGVEHTVGLWKEAEVKYMDSIGLIMGMVEDILNAITYVLVAFTSISLVVSSVMIGIITYVSVVERVKEIGVLRSLGARKKDIKNLFNAETFIIGLASGVFGVAVTYLLSLGINALLGSLTGIGTLASLPFGSALIMIAISVGLTLISGLIPAKAAAKKDPVVALRTE